MTRRSVVIGCGSYLPQKILTNAELAARVDTSDEWITQRSGIRQRHIAAPDEKTSDLATQAARAALASAGIDATAVDLVIVATATPDETFPAVATRVQAALGITRGSAFDVQAVCSGFVYALGVADSLLKTGMATRALVIGAEIFSRILDWNDRTTCVLFGDGAGAVVLEAQSGTDRGILSCHLHADGRQHDLLYTSGGVATTQTAGFVKMQGKEVFRHAVAHLAEVIEEALTANNISIAALDWLVPHQANQRIIEATGDRLGLPLEKVVLTVDRHGNTSAASVPLAFDTAVKDGRIKKGQLVAFEAMGGGFTWGSLLLRF